ncbi:MAG: hypothetical protein N2319_09440 [Candidatus Kapabacteria bacterium]|nr:hypothetical protein [Candidatus Kapabacteria bacterium]
MKRVNYLILLIIFFSFSLESFSQDRSLAIGIGAGLTRGVNEAKRYERTIGPLFGIYGLFNNGLMQNFTPELSISYYSNATENVGGFS